MNDPCKDCWYHINLLTSCRMVEILQQQNNTFHNSVSLHHRCNLTPGSNICAALILPVICFKLHISLIGKWTVAFSTAQPWCILKSWYTVRDPEQGFQHCLTDGLKKMFSSVCGTDQWVSLRGEHPSFTWCSDLQVTANQIIYHTFREKSHGLHTRLAMPNHRGPFSDFSWGEGGLYTG